MTVRIDRDPLALRKDPDAWFAGYRDGAKGRPAQPGEGYSYQSGWIEGDAARQRFKAAQARLHPPDAE